MSAQLTWKITQLERNVADGRVLAAVFYLDGRDDTYSAYGSDAVLLDEPEGELIPFKDLTEELVVGWVKDKLGEEAVEKLEGAVLASLSEQRSPTKAAGVPWQQ
jgi:hypothetical protein